VFLVLILIAVTETRQEHPEHVDTLQGFVVALRDRSLILFVLVNVVFTTYIALVSSTLPLYFTNVVSISSEATASGTSIGSIANLYTWCYIGLGSSLAGADRASPWLYAKSADFRDFDAVVGNWIYSGVGNGNSRIDAACLGDRITQRIVNCRHNL
jgi:hypothetical protein